MKRKCKRSISKSKTKKHKYVSEDGKVIVLDDEEFKSLKQLQKQQNKIMDLSHLKGSDN